MATQDEGFRSLIQTITKDDPQSNLSSEALSRLTERLGEIVGYDPSADFTPGRNVRGELVNEEGLPIIDITESEPGAEADEFIPPPEPIFRFGQIPSHTRNRLRQQRDSILDQLEQEERDEAEQESQKEREELAEQARKRAAAAASHKNAKELQKKMGKALLKSVAESKDKVEKAKEEQRIKDEEEDAKRKASSLKKKKSVKFAEPESGEDREDEWGDVVPGKIQPMKRPTLLSEASTKETMKMNVVERRPTRPVSPRPVIPEKDSDDESDVPPPSDDELQSDNELEDEADLNFASLQRQVQLEYYRKRATIGQDAASLIHNTNEPEGETTTEDTLGITKGDPSKPTISQYRASRLLSAYGTANPSSASNFVVPAASAKTMQNAIRTGKLDADGKLIGGEDDSASEAEDDTMQHVLELLKRGEVYNLGPNGEPIHHLPPKDNRPQVNPTETAAALGLNDESKKLPPLSTKNPLSKFKVSRAAARRNETPISETATPVNDLERSSPKLASPLPTPSGSIPPMVVDSPSFTLPAGIDSSLLAGQPPFNPFSMIVDSPSFPRSSQPPSSTPSSSAAPAPNPISNPTPVAPQVMERKTSRPSRPPTVIASGVREVGPPPTQGAAHEDTAPAGPPKKVSRFKMQRMQ